jgi:hypothetical protein
MKKVDWRQTLKVQSEWLHDEDHPFNFGADKLFIEISSGKDKPDTVPVDTIVRYRYKESGEWNYLIDADSGEQDGLATIIPDKLKQMLKAFGLTLKPDDKEEEVISNE